jgi:hypothetical protein
MLMNATPFNPRRVTYKGYRLRFRFDYTAAVECV